MAPQKQRLGNTSNIFSSIISEKEHPKIEEKQRTTDNIIDGKKVQLVALLSIKPDPNQPRKNIDPESPEIKELAESIKQHGFINFITVRANGPQDYIIVTGERRYTAATVAGLKEIPVMVIAEEKKDVDFALLQLEENLQRENLTPFEEADAYQRLKKEFGASQKEIAGLVKKDESYISKTINLTQIPETIRNEIEKNKEGVARQVLWDLSVFRREEQEAIWDKIKKKPVIAKLKIAIKQLAQEQKKLKKKRPTKIATEAIWDALERMKTQDIEKIHRFLTSKKIEALIQEFGEE